jgi:hypothetical protein
MLLTMKRALFVVLLLVACRGAPTTVTPDPTPTKASPAPKPPAPAPADVRVRVTMNSAHSYAIDVENAGGAPIDLSSDLDVELLADGGWTSVLRQGAHLYLGCTLDKCTTVAAGVTMHPGAWWVATAGCVQDTCVCQDGGPCIVDCLSQPALSGTYRIVARACDGGSRWESAPFVVPKS